MKKRIIGVILIAIIATMISVLMNQSELTKEIFNLVLDIWFVFFCCKHIIWPYIKYGKVHWMHDE